MSLWIRQEIQAMPWQVDLSGSLPELHPVSGFRLGTTSAGIKTPGRPDLVVMEMAAGWIFSEIQNSPAHQTLLEDLKNRRIDPFSAAEDLIRGLEYIK